MKKYSLSFLCILLLIPSLSGAEESASKIGKYRNEGIDVVQNRKFKKGMRHEFGIYGGVIPSNTFLMYESIQGSYTFHLRETLALEGWAGKVFHQNKSIIDDLAGIPCPDPNSDIDGDGAPDALCGVTLNPPPDPVKYMLFGNIVWSPIYGKFALFSKKVLYFDIMFTAGAGVFMNEDSNRFAFNVGTGIKVFANDFVAVRAEIKNITVREGAPFNKIANNQLYTIGASFFLPMKVK